MSAPENLADAHLGVIEEALTHTPYARIDGGGAVQEIKAAWLCRHPIAAPTSYAVVILRKPR